MAEADIYALRLIGSLGGQAINHVFGFTALTGTATRLGLAQDFNTSLLTTFLVGKSSQLTFTGIQVDDVVPGQGARVDFSITPPKVGNDATSDPLPPKDALVITWNTLTKGRSYRGRTFETGRVEAGQSAGLWIASTSNLAAAFAAAMIARYGPTGTSADYAFGVISRYLNKQERAQPVFTGITGYAIRPTVYSQRRRTIGYGS